MFDKVGRLAERVATTVSRRNFLTRLGSGALVFGTFLAGVAVFGASPWCVRNGGCCGGSTPYLDTRSGDCSPTVPVSDWLVVPMAGAATAPDSAITEFATPTTHAFSFVEKGTTDRRRATKDKGQRTTEETGRGGLTAK